MNTSEVSALRHALGTPLNHIIGYAEMLGEQAAETGDRETAAVMEQIRSDARLVAGLIRSGAAFENSDKLRGAMLPHLERIAASIGTFQTRAGEEFSTDAARIGSATESLLHFVHGGALASDSAGPEPPPATSADFGILQVPPQARRILVVDDDQANRDLLRRNLEREGFIAESEPDGIAALTRLGTDRFDLVLLDILMPGMDGFQVLAEIKTRPEARGVPVVVLSALDDLESAVRSISMGAEDFLSKPIDPVLLRARIGAILTRRDAEAERAELALSLELLLESTGDGVYGIDREGRCTFVNRAALEMLGYTREQLLGRELHSLIHHSRPDGSPYPSDQCPTHIVLETGAPQASDSEILFRADGSSFPADYKAHPIRREGRVDGTVVTFSNISERKRADEQLLQSAKLESLGVMAGGIAHDFNNILTGILGNASLVLESLPRSDGNRELLEEVVAASERAADLTRQMLAFAGKGQFVIEAFDISKAIQDIAELLESPLPKAVRLAIQLSRDLPLVEGDARQFQQLVFNLVINAGEAIGERPGLVLVETGTREYPEGAPGEPPFERIEPGRYVFAAVQDTGAGIDEATRARIFEPFFTTKFTGRGLGLPAVMGIARAHRGAVRLESEIGRGSRFEILLPAKPALKSATEPGTVLVVDDEEIVRRTTRSVLERKGYRVMLAENGQQAVEIFRQNADAIALVLLDLTMPVMGGEEAARYLYAIRPGIPILVSSGYNETDVARRFAGRRVAGYVRKPYTSGALLEKIAAALAAAGAGAEGAGRPGNAGAGPY